MRNRQRCVRCQTPDSYLAAQPHPRLEIRPCARCGWLNVTTASPQHLPVPQSLGIAGADELTRQLRAVTHADAQEATALFMQVAQTLADAAAQLIADAADFARAAAPYALHTAETELARHEGRPRGNDIARTATARAAALLFGLVADEAEVDFAAAPAAPATEEERRFHEQYWPIATDAAGIGSIVHQVQRGDVQISIRDGEFFTLETDQGLDIAEYLVNRRASPAPADFEKQQVMALREALALACNVDMRHLLRYALDDSGRARKGLLMVHKAKVPEDARATLETFSFSLERVRDQEEPWFASLLPRVRPLVDAHLGLSLLSRNWTAYYPIFSGVNEGEPIFVLGPQAVAITLENLMFNKNRVMQQLTELAPAALTPDAKARLSALRSKMNRHAETRAAQLLQGTGWQAQAGGTWGQSGAREEIDIVAARSHSQGVDVLVGEVKDFDLTLHRVRGPMGAAQRLRDSDAQLARKLQCVMANLPAVLRDLGVQLEARTLQVHALLITTDLPPADMLKAFAAADYAGLEEFSRLLREDRELALRIFGRATRTPSA